MNQPDAPDPQLELFTSQLIAMAPRLSAAEQQQILYECAFSAGQGQSRRALFKWRAATTVLGLLVVGMSLPMVSGRLTAQAVQPVSMPVVEATPPVTLTTEESLVATRKPISVRLDAWQIPASAEDPWHRQTAQLPAIGPSENELTVGRWQSAQLF